MEKRKTKRILATDGRLNMSDITLPAPNAPLPVSTYGHQIQGNPYAYKGFPYNQQPQPPSASTLSALAGAYLTPNLPSWIIPIFGTIATIIVVSVWPTLYPAVVIGLVGIILLWLTQPNS